MSQRRRGAGAGLATIAVLAVVAVVAAVAVGGVTARMHSSGDPTPAASPWPGATRVQTAFEPAASYSLPAGHLAANDDPMVTYWHFPGTRFSGVDLDITRVASYRGRQHDSVEAYLRELRRDDRLRVRSVARVTVDGEPAVRVSVRTKFGQPLTRSFCLPSGAPMQCWYIPKATVFSTGYLVRHDGRMLIIEAGGHNIRFSRLAARVLDSLVASWRWTG